MGPVCAVQFLAEPPGHLQGDVLVIGGLQQLRALFLPAREKLCPDQQGPAVPVRLRPLAALRDSECVAGGRAG